MERSNRGPTLSEIMAENGALKKTLQDTTSMLALICYQQEDKQIAIGVDQLAELPVGSYIDVAFDKPNQQYILKWQPADAPELPGAAIKSGSIIEVPMTRDSDA